MLEMIKNLVKWFILGTIVFVVIHAIIFLVFLPTMEIVTPFYTWFIGVVLLFLMKPFFLVGISYGMILLGWLSCQYVKEWNGGTVRGW